MKINPKFCMDKNYRKNICIKQIESAPCYKTFIECLEKVTSKKVLNTIIDSLIHTDVDTSHLYSYLCKKIKSNILFYDKCLKANFHLLLKHKPIREDEYVFAVEFYKEIKFKPIDSFPSFINLYVYQTICSFYKMEDIFPNFNSVLEKELFFSYFFKLIKFYEKNQIHKETFLNLKEIVFASDYKEKEIMLYLIYTFLNENIPICKFKKQLYSSSEINPEFIDLYNPLLITNPNSSEYYSLYLCYKNRNNEKCSVCGRSIKHMFEYFTNKEAYFEEFISNIINGELDLTNKYLNILIKHDKRFLTPKNFKLVLYYALYKNENYLYEILKNFSINEEIEKIILEGFKNFYKNIKSFKSIFKFIHNIEKNDKIYFAIFIIFYKYFLSSNSFMKLKIKNYFFKAEMNYLSLRNKIFEHVYLNDKTSQNTNEMILNDLACMFNSNIYDFIKNNMFFIFPVSLHCVSYSQEEITRNIFYLFIENILNGNNQEDLLGYDKKEIIGNNEYQIIAYLLLFDHKKCLILQEFLDEPFEIFLCKNITPILFNLRTIYFDCKFYSNILDIFKFIINILEEKSNIQDLYDFYEVSNVIEFYLESFIFSNPFIEDDFISKNENEFVLFYKTLRKFKNVIIPYLPINTLQTIINITNILLTKNINSEKGKVFLFEKIIELNTNNLEKEKIISEIFKRKIYSKKIDQFISNCKNISNLIILEESKKDFYFENDINSMSDLSLFLLTVLLNNINYDKQYIYYYSIQETIKYINNINNTQYYNLVKGFIKSKYFLEINLEQNELIYFKNISYSQFIHSLLLYILNDLNILHNNVYELTKFSLFLDDQVKEYYLLLIIKYLINKEEKDVLNKINEIFLSILKDKNEFIDKKIINFFLKLFIFSEKRIFSWENILEMALIVKNHFFIIYVVEKIIRKCDFNLEILNKYKNILMYSSFMINKYEYIKGLQSSLDSFDLINLFYNFCMEKNYILAKKCLPKENFDYNLEEILKINKETDLEIDVIEKIVNESSLTSWDNSYLKKLKNTIFYSENLTIESKLEKFKFFNDINLFLKNKELDLNNVNFKIYEDFCDVLKKKDYKEKANLNNLITKIKKIKINELIKNNEIETVLEEITNLLVKEEYGILYEKSKLLLKLNKKVEAKLCLKKLLNLFSENKLVNENLRIKSIILYCKIMESSIEYDKAVNIINNSEKLYFLQGKFYEEIDTGKSICAFIKSTKYGTKYLRESIPLIFHLFFTNNFKNNHLVENVLNDFINKTEINVLLPYFTQIIPKIASDSFELIINLLIRFYNEIPHKTFWDSFNFINSSSNEIKKRMNEVIQKIKFDSRVLLSSYTNVSEIFTKIALSKTQKSKVKYSDIIKKEIKFESVTLPNLQMDHFIEKIEEEITIFCSLQAPRRIEIIGSDGKRYFFLCKPNDDLRKDGRFIDLCNLLNQSFEKTEENVKIKLYKVIPFNHKTGVIEWINGLTSLKDLIYKFGSKNEIYEIINKYRVKQKIGIKDFKEIKIKAVLHKWLEENNNPKEWFYAREKFIQSYAVMNMIGWFMGLGDRHCENIMFDMNYLTVHVDLNCLFDKAKSFKFPEKVPFRLTHNILDAFGILKTEGCYRETMEHVLKLLIEKKNLIIANLLSFVYDPVFEWKKMNPSTIIDELKNKLEIKDIQNRVDNLIKEATDENNLSEMYIGWMPFV